MSDPNWPEESPVPLTRAAGHQHWVSKRYANDSVYVLTDGFTLSCTINGRRIVNISLKVMDSQGKKHAENRRSAGSPYLHISHWLAVLPPSRCSALDGVGVPPSSALAAPSRCIRAPRTLRSHVWALYSLPELFDFFLVAPKQGHMI